MESRVNSPAVTDQNPELPVQSGAVDTHCHLFLVDRQPADVVETARASGVDRVICVGVDVETSLRSLELADSIEGVFATAGVHPLTTPPGSTPRRRHGSRSSSTTRG
jgi:Tat protein secretion system quality control protein TatD with DNase activity